MFAKHPKGLSIIIFTEIWERFSFFGIRALLILFLINKLEFTDASAFQLYGAFFTLMYGAPVIGGYVAGRYLGYVNSVITGSLLMAIGSFLLGVCAGILEPNDAIGILSYVNLESIVFYGSFALLGVGLGLVKPSLASIMSALYEGKDEIRDSGFTFYYIGINFGAALAAISIGYIGQKVGWMYGFFLTSAAMIIGLITILYGKKIFNSVLHETLHSQNNLNGSVRSIALYAGGIVTALIIFWWLVQSFQLAGWIILILGILSIVGTIFYAIVYLEPLARDKLMVSFIIIIIGTTFWVLLAQTGGALTLFTDRVVDKNLWGINLEASQFQAFNPLFIIFLGPLMGLLWPALKKRDLEPIGTVKFGAGLLIMASGFWFISIISSHTNGELIGAWYLILTYLLITIGELLVGPISLSLISKLSPRNLTGMMIGIWFLSSAVSEFISAKLATQFTSTDFTAGSITTWAMLYGELFEFLAIIAVISGAFLLVLTPIFKSKLKI
ncbi:MAG: hypothetical protein COB36_10325 [Alphaproteobacteria bacterium]|nr:MAG: hypothetical protein COB36_10325 [Alphaproteobacteria bacterium]